MPQLEKTHEMPLSSRDEGLLFLHGLESNTESSLQNPQEAWLPVGHSVGSVHPDTPISIDTLFPGPLLLVAALSLLPLRPHQPTSLPCSSPSAFQPSHLQLPTHSGDGTSILPATRRTPMLQRKNLVRRDGDRGCGEGASTVLHSSVSPQKGTFLTGQGT